MDVEDSSVTSSSRLPSGVNSARSRSRSLSMVDEAEGKISPTSPKAVGPTVPASVFKTSSTTGQVCEICLSAPSKYTCPGCEMKTCSLLCVKEHKARLHCSGERNKTGFVEMTEYSDMHLLNDYRFLEDAERKLYSSKMISRNRQGIVHGIPNHLSKRSKLLMTAAYKRGIKLRMVSTALTKNKRNSSFYTISTDTIEWHIEWHFVTSNTVIKDEKVPENTILKDAVSKFTSVVQYPHLRKCLEDYRKENLENCRYLLKVEGLPANLKRYCELKPQASVAENLRGHCFTEYPSIMILTPSGSDNDYKLLSKDDLPVMDPSFARHLASHHGNFDLQTSVESQLLNPKSSVYTAIPKPVQTR